MSIPANAERSFQEYIRMSGISTSPKDVTPDQTEFVIRSTQRDTATRIHYFSKIKNDLSRGVNGHIIKRIGSGSTAGRVFITCIGYEDKHCIHHRFPDGTDVVSLVATKMESFQKHSMYYVTMEQVYLTASNIIVENEICANFPLTMGVFYVDNTEFNITGARDIDDNFTASKYNFMVGTISELASCDWLTWISNWDTHNKNKNDEDMEHFLLLKTRYPDESASARIVLFPSDTIKRHTEYYVNEDKEGEYFGAYLQVVMAMHTMNYTVCKYHNDMHIYIMFSFPNSLNIHYSYIISLFLEKNLQ